MTLRQWTTPFLIAASLSMGLAHAHADAAHVKADAAWARASVPGQQATGAFMRLTAEEPLRLVGVESPAAGLAEVHEMKMEGDVMRMRAIDGLDLPKGVAVDLKPGGYHVMLQHDVEAARLQVHGHAPGQVQEIGKAHGLTPITQ